MLSAYEEGQVFVLSTKSSQSNDGAVTKVSNISISDYKGWPFPLREGPNKNGYEFGDSCDASECNDCPALGHCRWSWPKGGTWESPYARCRCDYQCTH